MKKFRFVLFDNSDCDNQIIWAYDITAKDKASALNEFAQFVVSNEQLRYDIGITERIYIKEV